MAHGTGGSERPRTHLPWLQFWPPLPSPRGCQQSAARPAHTGTFTALVQCTNTKLHRLVQKESALVVPDASRILFSISQALLAGHHVHFGNSPGLLLHSTKTFVPFVRDSHSGMYLLPLIPPASRHNGTYPLQQAMRATGYTHTRSPSHPASYSNNKIHTLGHYSTQYIGPYCIGAVNNWTSAFRNHPARKLPAQYVSQQKQGGPLARFHQMLPNALNTPGKTYRSTCPAKCVYKAFPTCTITYHSCAISLAQKW